MVVKNMVLPYKFDLKKNKMQFQSNRSPFTNEENILGEPSA